MHDVENQVLSGWMEMQFLEDRIINCKDVWTLFKNVNVYGVKSKAYHGYGFCWRVEDDCCEWLLLLGSPEVDFVPPEILGGYGDHMHSSHIPPTLYYHIPSSGRSRIPKLSQMHQSRHDYLSIHLLRQYFSFHSGGGRMLDDWFLLLSPLISPTFGDTIEHPPVHRTLFISSSVLDSKARACLHGRVIVHNLK